MKKKPKTPSDSTGLRRSAEARWRATSASRDPQAEVDLPRLQQELEVHRIELEMQNEELRTARAELETGLERYTDLFDFAPAGYFNLNAAGIIQLVNLTGAKFVGLERARLMGRRFGSFVAAPDRGAFNDCLKRVFATQIRQACEVTLVSKERPPIFVRLEVMLSADGKECRVVVMDIHERKRAEAVLRESERFTQSTIDALSAHLCVLDETGAILATNEAWRRFAEANPPTAHRAQRDANYLQVCDAATGPEAVHARAFAAGIRAVIRGEQASFALEYPCHSPTEQRWFVGRVTRFPGDGPVRLVVAHENITERKLAEEALRDRESRLHAIIQTEPECVKVVDRNGRLVEMNRAGLAMLEAGSLAAAQQIPLLEFIVPEYRAAFHDLHRRVMAGGDGTLEFEIIGMHGGRRWLETHAAPLRDAAGQVQSLLAITRDITARRRMEEASRESEQRMNTMFNASPAAICVNTVDAGRVIDINEQFVQFTGFAREELIGRTILELKLWADPEARAPVMSRLKTDGFVRDVEAQFRRKNGEVRDVLVSCERVELTGESAPVTISMFLDVTERKRAEATLAETSQTLVTVTEALAAYVERGDWKEAMGRLLRCAVDQTKSEYGFIGVVVDSTLRVLAHEGIVWDKVINRDFYEQALNSYEKVGYLEFANFNNLFGRAITTGQVVIANMPDSDPRSGGRPTGHPPMRSFLGVPIFVGEQVHGMVALANRPGGYSEEEQHRIETLVQHAGGLCTSYRQREAAVILEQERAEAEAALAQAEGSRRAVWQSSIDAIITMDESGHITDFNPAAEKTFGYRAADVIGHPLADKIIPPALREGHRRGMAKFLATGQGPIMGRRIELSALRSDGTEFPAELAVVSVTRADRPTFLGTVRDITERKRAEEALRASEANMAAAQRISHFGSWELNLADREDASDLPLQWSDEMFRIAGYKPGEVQITRELFYRLVHPEDREMLRQAVAVAIRERGPYAVVHRLIQPSGEERLVQQSAQIFFDEKSGQPVRLVGTTHDITELRKAETERNRLFNLSLDMLCVAGFDGTFQQVNPAWTEHLGWTAEELTSRSSLDFVHPEDREATQRTREQIIQGQPVRSFENRYRCKDGSWRWLSWNVHPFLESRQVFGVARDITEQRQLAEHLAVERARLIAAQSVAKVGSWETDLASMSVIWSDETHRIFETDPAAFSPSHEGFLESVHPEDRAAVDQAFQESFHHCDASSCEHRLYFPGGRIKFVEERWRIICDAAGQPVRAVGTCQDITERKAAEDKVRASEAQFRQLAESNILGLLFWDAQGDISDANDAFLQMVGYTRDELRSGQIDWRSMTPPEHRATDERALAEIAATGRCAPFEKEYFRKDGSRVAIMVGAAALDGATDRGICYVVDISQQKQAEAKVREAAQLANLRAEIAAQLTAPLALPDITRGVCELLVRHLGMAFARVWTLNEAEQVLELQASAGLYTHLDGPHARVPMGQFKIGRIAQNRKPHLTNQVSHDTEISDPAWAQREGMVAFAGYPLMIEGRVLGVLGMFSRHALSEQVFGELPPLADWIAQCIQRKRDEATLRVSEERFRTVAKATNDAIWDWDLTTNHLLWNEGYEKLFGYSRAEVDPTLKSRTDYIHPEDLSRVTNGIHHVIEHGGEDWSDEYRFRCQDGRYSHVLDRGHVIRDAAGQPVRMIGGMTDLTKLKEHEIALSQSNRALQLLSRCNEALIRSESESGLLATICQIAVDVGGFRLAWVGYAREDAAKTIVVQTHAGVEEGYLSQLRLTWAENEPAGQSPAGQVIRHGKPVVIPDLETDESFRPWLEAARARGFRGVIVLPLTDQKRTFGVLVLYLPEARQPLPDEMSLLRELADDLAFGIVNIRTRLDRRRIHAAVVQVAAAVSTATNKGFFEQLARNMAAAVGAQAGFVAQMLPGEPLTARTIAAVVDNQVTANFDYVLHGTPCESFFTSDTCIIHEQVAQEFPQSPALAALNAHGYVGRRLDSSAGKFLGLLFVLFREPLQEADFVTSTLQIFSARAAAELERQETDTQVREQAALLDKAQDAILVRDLDHRITYWNSSAARVYGWTAEEVMGRSVRELFYAEPRILDQAMEQLLAHGEWSGNLKHKRKDGRTLDVQVRWTLVRDAAGQPKAILSINTDITERKAAELAVQRSEERFRELAENIQEVFWMTDPAKNQMIYISPAYEKIWGRTCASLQASPRQWLDAIHPDDRERVLEAAVTKQARGDYDETYRIQRPDGAVRWIHDRAVPVRGAAGEILRVVGTAEDITDRRQLEEQFRQSQKMEAIGQLAGGVAHDFNNILAVMMMQAELTGMGENLPDRVQDGLRQIRAAAERAASLTRQLLLFSRKQVMQSRQLDLNEVVTSLAKMLQRIIGEDVRLQLNLHSRPLLTRADAGMLDQVLMNLVVNARDAMPGGGQLCIETSESVFTAAEAAAIPDASPGRYVCLRVTDTGSGMPPEILAHIFEPFFTTKETGKGTGLGLATVFGIVKQHNGALTVESDVGKGTTFRLFLHAEEATAQSCAEEAVKPRPRGGTETILLVEDEPAVRRLTRIVLERAGYNVLEAAQGIEALNIWEREAENIRLLLTDIVMPEGISGRELAARLREKTPGLRVLFTSGYSADIAGRELALQEGQNFIQKPVAPQQLLETVRRCLDA